MANIDIRETRIRRMAEELEAIGVDVPDFASKGKDTSLPAGPSVHHHIAHESDRRIAFYLADLAYRHPHDPALQVVLRIYAPCQYMTDNLWTVALHPSLP